MEEIYDYGDGAHFLITTDDRSTKVRIGKPLFPFLYSRHCISAHLDGNYSIKELELILKAMKHKEKVRTVHKME